MHENKGSQTSGQFDEKQSVFTYKMIHVQSARVQDVALYEQRQFPQGIENLIYRDKSGELRDGDIP
jgi:hypothetical protein